MANPRATRKNYGQDVQFEQPSITTGGGAGHGAGRTFNPQPGLWDAMQTRGTMTNKTAIEQGMPHLSPAPSPYVDELYSDAGPLIPFGRGSLAGAGNPALDINGFADAGPLIPFGRGTATSAPQSPLDDYENYQAPVPTNAKTAAVVAKASAPARTKKQKAKRGAARAAVTKAENKAVAQKFATVDPLNLFGNKNGANPFNPNIKGSNRFSGGDVRINDRSAPGGRGAYGYNNDDVMSMF